MPGNRPVGAGFRLDGSGVSFVDRYQLNRPPGPSSTRPPHPAEALGRESILPDTFDDGIDPAVNHSAPGPVHPSAFRT
jgi:hypothetical protein